MKLLSKIIATSLLLVWGYSFAHLVYMGTLPLVEDCPHSQNSHELCKLVLSTQATEKIKQKEFFTFLLVVIPFLFAVFPLARLVKKVTKQVENHSPPLFQELYSSGILNPKAP